MLTDLEREEFLAAKIMNHHLHAVRFRRGPRGKVDTMSKYKNPVNRLREAVDEALAPEARGHVGFDIDLDDVRETIKELDAERRLTMDLRNALADACGIADEAFGNWDPDSGLDDTELMKRLDEIRAKFL